MKAFQITPLDIKHAELQVNCTFQIDTKIMKLKNTLNTVKSKLDNMYKYKCSKSIMISFDPFIKEKYKIAKKINTYNVTNAWLKGYEIIDYFNLIPKIYDKKKEFVYFDNASYPGSFIIAAHHYVNTQTNIKNFKWYGASLKNNCNLGDDFNLEKNYPNKWLMNEFNNGDITKIENIIDFSKQLNNKHNERTVNVFSCDLGLNWGTNYNEQEIISFTANICQILCGLLTLKSDGHMFVKHFTLFESFTLSYISLLTMLFKEVYITKPISSKRTNSEVYIVCKNYKYPFSNDSIEKKIIELFIKSIKLKTTIPLISSGYIKPQMDSIYNACNSIYKTQIISLNLFKEIVKQKKEPLVIKRYYNELQCDNLQIINEFNKIKIKPINKQHQLYMYRQY
jgi:hypothetical protein